MKRLLKNTAKTVASALAVVSLLSSTSYAGQTTRHHKYTNIAVKMDCRRVLLIWRSCTYSYVGANQVSKTRAKLPNSEIAVGFYTGSIFADSTGRPARKSSSALWGSTSTDVGFSGGSTFGSTHGSASDGTTRGSLAGNSEQQGGGASNQPSRGQETASSSPSSPSGGGGSTGGSTGGTTAGSGPSDTPTGPTGGGLGPSTPSETDPNDGLGEPTKGETPSTPTDSDDTKPGHGYGDKNHEHSGPPGQDKDKNDKPEKNK